jgi:alanyl-tRNA synthetase
MAQTERLYLTDSKLFDFDARVVGHGSLAGVPTVLLDRSAFYPEAGGQMADRGVLGGLAVLDVQQDDEGRVHHRLEGEPLPLGARVEGHVERGRRRLFMALHTGQHMLSAALAERGAETISSRLGETTCTIDTSVAGLAPELLEAAEAEVNAWIEEALPVRVLLPSADELARLRLRRAPKVDEGVRVVCIGDHDLSPCGGTHCASTSEVGLVRVLGSERYKGGTRVTFAAGARARALLFAESDRLRALAARFTCGVEGVAAAVEKLRAELDGARAALGAARGRLALSVADELASAAEGARVVALLDDGDAAMLRVVATRLLDGRPERVVVLGAPDGSVLAARGASSSVDCGALVKALAARAGGRGGGRAERAEGKLAEPGRLQALAREALDGPRDG